MNRFVTLSLGALGALAMTQGASPLGSILTPGMRLVYATEGTESPPWTIDSVVRDVSVADRTGCIRLRLRINPARAVPDTRIHCVESMMMLNWDSVGRTLRPARPLGAGGVLEIPNPGGRVRFEASQPTFERIRIERGTMVDSLTVAVIPTTVTTFDSTGRAIRRLRERFANGLATATGGVFEVADSTAAGGWRGNRRFELVAIRMP